MPRVTIYSREEATRITLDRQVEYVVSVTWSTVAIPPRLTALPRASYSPAPEALRGPDGRIQLVPKDQPALQAERAAILKEIQALSSGPLPTFEW